MNTYIIQHNKNMLNTFIIFSYHLIKKKTNKKILIKKSI